MGNFKNEKSFSYHLTKTSTVFKIRMAFVCSELQTKTEIIVETCNFVTRGGEE